jgi:hypothetical protein
MEQSSEEIINTEEIVYEPGETRGEIIHICSIALSVCESYDYSMQSREDKDRIDNIRRMALILTEGFLTEIYYENYED